MENLEYKLVIYPGLTSEYFKIKLNNESPFLTIKQKDFPEFLVEYKFVNNIKRIFIKNKA